MRGVIVRIKNDVRYLTKGVFPSKFPNVQFRERKLTKYTFSPKTILKNLGSSNGGRGSLWLIKFNF